jgi:CHAT domain-containing protein
MNEQRTQAYVNLIERLLTCADDEELNNILQANQDLTDPQFLQVMEYIATGLEEQGNNNPAAWLRNMAQQLGQYLNRQGVSIEEYQEFLFEVLQAEYESNGDPTQVYPILQRRQHLLDDTFAQLLQQWARNKFSQGKVEEVAGIAGVIGNLCNKIRDFPLGSRANNLDISIIGYHILLQVYTRDAFPEAWAGTQNNLGNAYSDRIRGERTENIELAITAYNQSLEVYTREAFPEDWARTQNNLGNAYCKRIRGDILESLQMAFTCYQNALTIYTRENFPQKWNDIQNNLVKIYYGNIQTQNFDKDQQFQQAYFDLIQSLLICPQGEEDSILESHVELIDIHLIEMMKNIANLLQFYGREFESNWLQFTSDQLLSQDLVKRAGFSDFVSKSDDALSSTHVPDYLDISDHDFLMEVLHRVKENPDPQYIYPLLERNISRLNYRYLGHRLEIWANHEFFKVGQTDAQDIALVILNFGVLLNQFEKGNKESNQELAILAYKIAENIFKFENCPKNWAVLQYNLGNSYIKRIKGNKAENLEQALIYYQQALKVYNNTSFPNEWASTQINISSVYKERFKDDRADNIEKSIECLNNALQIFNRNNHPYEWGITQLNLSGTYLIRIKGDFYKNLDYALVCCQNALEILTIDHYPYEYAEAQYNLGSIYQNNINKRQSKNIEKARKAYESAAQIFTYENYPYQWAATQEGLALVYLDRIQGDKLDDLNQALEYSYQALRIYTPKNLVYEWANIQETLGDIYSQLTDDLENVERAIVAYQYALRIFTLQAFPRKCYQVNTKLGHIYFSINNWKSATEAYNLAIKAVENIRLEALNPQRQQEILSDAMDVYHGIIQSYLNLNQKDRALEYVERSKTRYLVQLLTDRDIYPKGNIPQTIITELDRLRRAIIGEEQRLAIQEQTRNQGVILTPDQQKQPILNDYTHLNHLKQELKQFIDREITPIDPTFSLTQKVESIPISEIQSLIDQDTAILEWYISGDSIMAFIVTNEGLIPPNPPSKGGDFDSEVKGVKVWQSSESDLQIFIETIDNYLQLYYSENSKQEWIKKLPNFLQSFSEILHLTEIINLIPSTCQRLIIIPHRFLHILPIHAFPIGEDKVLQNKYTVQYAPSCQLLQRIQQPQQNQLTPLLAIQNPTKDLIFTDLEVNIIATLFQPNQIIAKDNATQNTVTTQLKNSNHHCHHFSCHGSFNPNKPLESALILAEQEPLTLGKIFELNLKKSRLVVLSACETGMIDIQSISDEYIGLPSGFLFAGSQNVVSSLWTVNDLSTAFLMIKFYQILLDSNQQVSMAIALKTAQNWLRTLNREKFTSESNKIISKLDNKKPRMAKSYKKIAGQLLLQNTEEYPFQNPYYWAAFIASGH